jgi:ELWxxDGT repeat protein
VTDGSAAGTHRLGNVNSGPTITVVDHLIPIGNKVYFGAYSPLFGFEPWVSDGTEAGTHMFANIGQDGPPSSSPAPIFGSDTLLFFKANTGDPATGFIQTALWRSDGTSSGTFSLGNVGDPPPSAVAPQPTVVFLNTDTSLNSQTLYASDGTPQGTRVATDIVQRFPNASVSVRRLFLFGDRLYATLFDGSGHSPLWVTTTAPNAPAVSVGIQDVDSMIDVAGRQFVKTNGNGLWSTDGTVAGTYAISPLAAPISGLAKANGAAFFLQRSNGENTKLWKTDGTYEGTVVVKTLTSVDLQTQEIKGAGGRVYFTSGGSLWTSDGTDAGTISLMTLLPPTPGNDLLYPAGSSVFFIQAGTNGYDVWSSDGTQAGTKRLTTVSNAYPFLTPVEDRLYFNGYDASHGVEPWVTDGTLEGTRMVGDVNPGTGSSSPAGFMKAGNAVYFSAYDATFGDELWALPLTDERLTVDDTRVAVGGTTAHFTVKLAPAATKSITVDYATSDGTAHAGNGYDSATGTLTFAPGETSKTIEVQVRHDSAGGIHTFFVTLRNPGGGARLVRADAAGIIEDGNEVADLSLAHDIDGHGGDYVTILNHGPNAALNVTISDTTAPEVSGCCKSVSYPLIAAGGTALRPFIGVGQNYGSATVTAQQRDPNPADNSISWTNNGIRSMSMTPAFIATGATGRVSVDESGAVTSSDPSVISVPATTGSVVNGSATFNIVALKPGTAVIGVAFQSLVVTVVAPGTQPRLPGAISVVCCQIYSNSFDAPAEVDVLTTATALFSGAKPTGGFTVSAGGRQVGRAFLSGDRGSVRVYLPALGANFVQVAYDGDQNFLPMSVTVQFYVSKGNVTLNASLEPVAGAPGSFQLKVDANGSPASPPTGTLTVMNGSTQIASVALAPTSGGTSAAQTVLANLSGSPTLTIQYAGDAFYLATSQQVRALQPHRRAVHH